MFGFYFWKKSIMWPSEPFGSKKLFYVKIWDRTFAFSAHEITGISNRGSATSGVLNQAFVTHINVIK